MSNDYALGIHLFSGSHIWPAFWGWKYALGIGLEGLIFKSALRLFKASWSKEALNSNLCRLLPWNTTERSVSLCLLLAHNKAQVLSVVRLTMHRQSPVKVSHVRNALPLSWTDWLSLVESKAFIHRTVLTIVLLYGSFTPGLLISSPKSTVLVAYFNWCAVSGFDCSPLLIYDHTLISINHCNSLLSFVSRSISHTRPLAFHHVQALSHVRKGPADWILNTRRDHVMIHVIV
jgi:hypothetical protein